MQFFLTVGVITSIIIYALGAFYMSTLGMVCYKRMREAHADYRYDLNLKSCAMVFVHATSCSICGWTIILFGYKLIVAIVEVM